MSIVNITSVGSIFFPPPSSDANIAGEGLSVVTQLSKRSHFILIDELLFEQVVAISRSLGMKFDR
jgi:hypothetical protein